VFPRSDVVEDNDGIKRILAAAFAWWIDQGWEMDNPGQAVFDPARQAAPEGSLFACDGTSADGWRKTAWLSTAHTQVYP